MSTEKPAEWTPDAPELAPIGAGSALDWVALEGYLRDTLPGLRGDFEPQRLPRGGAEDAFRVRFGPTLLVVRTPTTPPEQLERAHELLGRLPSTYDRAPRAVHLCLDPSVAGRPFQVLQYLPGFVVHDRLPNAFVHEPDVGDRLAGAVVDALADLHAVDGSPVHGAFALAKCQFNAHAEEGDPEVVTGVLGWDAARFGGDPLTDLRSLVVTWPGAALGLPDAAELVARYADRTGRSVAPGDVT